MSAKVQRSVSNVREPDGRSSPRVLVGVLYSGEEDFRYCVAAIKAQRGVDLAWFVIEHLPNKQAHEALYETFMQKAAEARFFVKVDADMVLRSPDLVGGIARIFSAQPDVDLIRIPVRDYFTGRDIAGLNAFRSTVKWPACDDEVFVDQKPVSRDRTLTAKELAPAADHCFRCSEFQAFHYGVHRGVKLQVSLCESRWRSRAAFHLANYEQLWSNAQRNPSEKRLWLACAGVEMCLLQRFDSSWVPYTDSRLWDFFTRELASLSAEQTRARAQELRRQAQLTRVGLKKLRLSAWRQLKSQIKRRLPHMRLAAWAHGRVRG